MTNNDSIKTFGDVSIEIKYKNEQKENLYFKNTILNNGREALSKSLAKAFTGDYAFYISRMIFGNGGTAAGSKKHVSAERNGLFGVEQASKPVISNVDSNFPSQVVFTSVLRFDDAVGQTINEMGLRMSNNNLYSMVTFADINKTEDMQITFNWRLSFV